MLDSRNRKDRKKLFKAAEAGDFRGYDFDDDIVLCASYPLSHPSTSLTCIPPSAGRKKKGKPSTSGHFVDELQAQWENDRSKKGEYKKARALARATTTEFSTPHLKKGSKPSASSASDVVSINYSIREFLMHDVGRTTLSLPPMSKKSRVAVHLLSEAYGLKSKSLGKGAGRYPVLERTSRSGVFGVDERKINAILGTASGETRGNYGGGKALGKQGGLWAALSGDKRGGSGGASQRGGKANRDGGMVGEGAPELGASNIGFALLKKMG